MRYLGIEPKRPRVAFFDFTGCEGCQLQISNKEETLVPFLNAIEVVNFREISSMSDDNYEIAFIDGSISRYDEVKRLQSVREKAQLLVAMGSCACFGGVNKLKNSFDLQEANREVYGNHPKETLPTRSVKEIVSVDLEIPGCPVSKGELERILQHIVWDIPYRSPAYPVCLECKQRYTVCMFEKGHLCLGPITQGGCDAPCPAGGLGCWGCRGPSADPNYEEFLSLAKERGFSEIEIQERLNFFGGFKVVA
jgi:coenzyme F420-reducing hydrogenase gamma subunit